MLLIELPLRTGVHQQGFGMYMMSRWEGSNGHQDGDSTEDIGSPPVDIGHVL